MKTYVRMQPSSNLEFGIIHNTTISDGGPIFSKISDRVIAHFVVVKVWRLAKPRRVRVNPILVKSQSAFSKSQAAAAVSK